MKDDLLILSRNLGSLFLVVGAVALFAAAMPFVFREYFAVGPIIITAGVFFSLGGVLYILGRNAGETNFKDAMITAALGWLLVSLIGSIPFFYMSEYEAGEGMEPVDAVYESFAGWTGTGFSMVLNEERLPYSLQFWRSLIQWIGGVGVIVLTLAILARPGTGSFTLYKSEGREEKMHPSIISTVKTIWWIFILYTLLGIFLFHVSGMPLWEAINHCMTGLSTGGFSVTNESMSYYGVWTQWAIILMMILGAIAFVAHNNLLRGKVKKFVTDPQVKALFVLIVSGGLILTLVNYFSLNNLSFLQSLQESLFQYISAITCTGFYSADISAWGDAAKLILSLAMVIGGAAGSTAGGIKLFRAVLLSKGVFWRTRQAISTPRRFFSHKLGRKFLSSEDCRNEVNEAAVISFLWAVFLFIGILAFSILMPHHDLIDIIFEICSAQGNVGLSSGITGPAMPAAAKVVMMFNMWIGRLEIIPIIVLFRSILGKD
ncbi:MAG: TrkH family potassium uptake protein [archaeon]|nr:MAG: TrkH family potassium uptake protein [archaeon]